MSIPRVLRISFLSALAVLLTAAAPASADVSWVLNSSSNTTVDPDGHATITTLVQGASSPVTNEVQRLEIDAGGGQFRLGFGAEVTSDLPFDASAAQVQAALEALPAIGVGNVELAPMSEFSATQPYRIVFKGALGAQDFPPAHRPRRYRASRGTLHLLSLNREQRRRQL